MSHDGNDVSLIFLKSNYGVATPEIVVQRVAPLMVATGTTPMELAPHDDVDVGSLFRVSSWYSHA